MAEQKMTPQQALSNVIGICTRYTGYAWGEQQIIVDSLRLIDSIVNPNPQPVQVEDKTVDPEKKD